MGKGATRAPVPRQEKKLVVMTTENIGRGPSIGSRAQNYVSIAGGWDSPEVPCTMGKTALSRTDSCGIWARPFVAGSTLGYCGYLVLVLEHTRTVNANHFQERSLPRSVETRPRVLHLGFVSLDTSLLISSSHHTKTTLLKTRGWRVWALTSVLPWLSRRKRRQRPCDAGNPGVPNFST